MKDLEIPLGKRTLKYRFFEMLPALCSYSLLLLPFVLSFISPLYAAIFITGFIIWWFVKAIGMAYRTFQGYRSLDRAKTINWLNRLNDLEDPAAALKRYETMSHKGEWHLKEHYQNLLRITQHPSEYFPPSQLYSAVIVTIVNENDVLEATIRDIISSNYNLSNLILLIAYEERGPESTHLLVKKMAEKYGVKCFHAAAVMHVRKKDELIGKGGNLVATGHYLQNFLKQKQIDPGKVIVTTLDCDNRAHAQYLACVAYEYIVDPHRDHRAFQPITLFLNNIWDAPAPMRVLATGNSFWAIINSMRPHMLRNFASHSQGMASLNKTNLWSVRSIVEDGHQYWRSYFAFKGDYEVTPIYVPIYQDAVLAETYRKTLRAQFIQLRRWAYGASDVAYVGDKGFGKGRTVPLPGLIARFGRLLEGHVSWAVAPILITLGAWIPLVINPEASRSIVAHELPQVASQLQTVATVGLFLTVYLAFKMLPPRPERYKRRRNLLMLAQWLLMPVVSICYGSAAAFNSQTRLLIGKYLDKFDVTAKAVKK